MKTHRYSRPGKDEYRRIEIGSNLSFKQIEKVISEHNRDLFRKLKKLKCPHHNRCAGYSRLGGKYCFTACCEIHRDMVERLLQFSYIGGEDDWNVRKIIL